VTKHLEKLLRGIERCAAADDLQVQHLNASLGRCNSSSSAAKQLPCSHAFQQKHLAHTRIQTRVDVECSKV